MRHFFLLILVLALRGGDASAGPLLVTHPAQQLRDVPFEIEYVRPWGELPVQRGRVAVGVRLPFGGRIGAVAEALQTPTVDEVGWGLWWGQGDWLHAEALVQDTEVDALQRTSRLHAAIDLAVQRPLWAIGTHLDARNGAERTVVRKSLWLSVSAGGSDLFVQRTSQPWTDQPVLHAGLVWQVFSRMSAGAYWRQRALEFSVGWRLTGMEWVASSVWSGPQAGAFGFRIAGEP